MLHKLFARRKAKAESTKSDYVGPELNAFDRETLALVRPYTMTSQQRVQALILATRYVARRRIAGAFVECGVWRGGSMMAARAPWRRWGRGRDLYLFDTFAGMPAPTRGCACARWRSRRRAAQEARRRATRADASLDNVKAHGVGALRPGASTRRGKVEDTSRQRAPEPSRCCGSTPTGTNRPATSSSTFTRGWPPGGVLIIDDYGHWAGARRAVDEYFRRPPRPSS